MQRMGLAAIYQRPRTSRPAPEHRIYPYLLRGLSIERVHQVWAADITYIPMARGFLYLVAVMDWVSRYVLAWRLSNLLDASFCIEALEEALSQGRPEIFNTDQGSQFTDDDFTGVLRAHGVAISMDGRGRFADNIFVERLWRSLKYEEVYLKAYENVAQARQGIAAYFEFYNHQRLHQALGYRTPQQLLEGVGPQRYNIYNPQTPPPPHEFFKASGNLLRGSRKSAGRKVLVLNFPSGHAMSSRRLFLSGLLSSRARLRFAGLTILPTQNAPRYRSTRSRTASIG